ncbi:hypothetical protein W97_09269 [Coniosporium apollinis CBS 100218]|uniref:FAD-binding domain-containing protein n=1 Tax=Coniosporium apollinis (strain CBS 100218) TaxID=1168221 RepID=R7Z7B6_CONA1|nr:uncharacterized protein W97_09269 [Coniosporium apollinis CBS 100218]EON70003.1 hypothetical protein W97_09269 [Coniosporium apollinis CBS 100218]
MAATTSHILVVGGGPAGATAAFWLARAGFEVTVAERSSDKFTYGQGIDITGPAIPIVQKMGLYESITSQTTGEKGFAIVNDSSDTIAHFGAGAGATLTQEIEIMRGDLVRILAEAADASDKVHYRYGCTVSEIQQSETHVTVVLTDSKNGKTEDFAAVIGADGLNSKVRRLVFDNKITKDCYIGTDQYCAYFSMKGEPDDVPNSRLQHAPGRRTILIRPTEVDSTDRSSCYMAYFKSGDMESAVGRPVEDQKAVLAEIYEDFPGRLGIRALQGMWNARDFYYSETAQIKLPTWSSGRCVLVGDAAYAPSAASGQGVVLAILGSYVIAGELAARPDEPHTAFTRYEERLRHYVKESQSIPVGGLVAKLAIPETYTGIRILRFLFWLAAQSGVWKWFNIKQNTFDLPKYTFALATDNK